MKPFIVNGKPEDLKNNGYKKLMERARQHGFNPERKTNGDKVRSMTDDELAEWYWWMLHYVQGYTDSRVALREWLKEEFHGYLSS